MIIYSAEIVDRDRFGDFFRCHNFNSVDPESKILKLRKRPFKWCHQSSYLRDKSICQFGDTMDYSPWSEAEK